MRSHQKRSTAALEVRQVIRQLALRQKRLPEVPQQARLVAAEQPFDRLLLAASPLYREVRRQFLRQEGRLEPALLSSPRSLSGSILLEDRIQYSPIESELLWTATDPGEPAERLLDLRTFTTSVFHEQVHRLLWRFLPPSTTDSDSIRRYLNLAESLVVMTDMMLSDTLGPGLAKQLYLTGALYDPGTSVRRTVRAGHRYRRYLCVAAYATYLNLEFYHPKDVRKVIEALFGSERHSVAAAERALRLDRQFVVRTNPAWQVRNQKPVLEFLSARYSGSTAALQLPEDPLQHDQATFWADRWLEQLGIWIASVDPG